MYVNTFMVLVTLSSSKYTAQVRGPALKRYSPRNESSKKNGNCCELVGPKTGRYRWFSTPGVNDAMGV